MKIIFYIILAATILTASALSSAEIIPVWNKEVEDGSINDMQLLKGGDEFLMILGNWDKGRIQTRSVEDGELINTQPANLAHNSKIIITPDSSRFILLNDIKCELRNLDDDFSIIKSFDLEVLYTSIAIDPIRPYIYVTGIEMRAYNYETGELVNVFEDYISDIDTKIDVSLDGKYLATLNDGKAYLKVWDLETFELIRDLQLWDEKLPNNDWRCESKDVQFSKLNTDVIYFSGKYPALTTNLSGLFKYNISLNEKTKNIQERTLNGKFILFDDEKRNLIYTFLTLYFNNLNNKEVELYGQPPFGIFTGGKTIYIDKDNIFIGFANSNFCKFLYDRQTSIENDFEHELIVSPNPTNGIVEVKSDC